MKRNLTGFRLNTKKRANGSVIVITAICIFVFMGIAALAIDVGYLYATRAETQNAADAAALAGARELAQIYKDYREIGTTKISEIDGKLVIQQEGFDAILAVLSSAAANNRAAKESISIDPKDVKIGAWDPTKFENENERDVGVPQYDANGNVVSIALLDPADPDDQYLIEPNAVRVIAKRTGIGTFFANIFKIASADVSSKKAVAALSGPGEVVEGIVNVPFGLASSLFPDKCKDVVEFYPTGDSCAGWHRFMYWPASESKIEETIFNLIAGHDFKGDDYHEESALLDGREWLLKNWDVKSFTEEISPSITAGEDSFNFTNGTTAGLFQGPFLWQYEGGDNYGYEGNAGKVLKLGANTPYADADVIYNTHIEEPINNTTPAAFQAMFDYFRYRDNDGNDDEWTTFIPVYLDESGVGNCDSPAGPELIVGFAVGVIRNVNPAPDKTMDVFLPCEPVVLPDRGSGLGAYGNLYGLIPNLVK